MRSLPHRLLSIALLLCLAAGGLAACGGGGGGSPPPTPPGTLDLQIVGAVDLGTVPVGSPVQEAPWTLSNVGTGALTIDTISITGLHASEFAFQDAVLPIALAAGQQVVVTLGFDPAVIGTREANIEFGFQGEQGDTGSHTFDVTADVIAKPITFEDVTAAAGIVTSHSGGLRIGQAWGDVNGDGWLDFFVTDSDGEDSLFLNNQDGTFTKSSMVFPAHPTAGAVFGDYDNDGWADLYVCRRDGPNQLYHNVAGTLVEVAAAAGVGDLATGSTAAWGDYDKDGDLDLYSANYDVNQPDTLYENQGDGTFQVVTHYLSRTPLSWALAVSFVDYDNDGDLDIYLVTDARNLPATGFPFITTNLLYRNDGAVPGGWAFTEVGAAAGADLNIDGMCLASADYDQNGTIDFFMTDIGPAEFLKNKGDGTFEDASAATGTNIDSYTWGSVFADFDLDGWTDLYVTSHRTPNYVFRNKGDGTFDNVSGTEGATEFHASVGVAYADYDKDGDIDLLIGNNLEGYQLLRNLANPPATKWVAIRLIGAGPIHKQATGARATLTMSDGRIAMQEVKNGSSHGAGSDLALHWGLGAATPVSLEIKWPDGTIETLTTVPTGVEIQHTYPVP